MDGWIIGMLYGQIDKWIIDEHPIWYWTTTVMPCFIK